MRDDDAKRAILARRARFVAAAMMGAGLASCEREPPPVPCLSVAIVPPDAAPPQPCLSIAVLTPPPDGTGTTIGGGADAGSPDAGDVKPRPCLKIKPPDPQTPKPRICLDVAP
jgi:hypothetical protein